MTLPIVTLRLILRRYSEADIPDLAELLDQPSFTSAIPEIAVGLHLQRQNARRDDNSQRDARRGESELHTLRKYIELQNSYLPFERNRFFDLAVELKTEHKVIGVVSLVRRPYRMGETRFAISEKYRKQGYTTEAVHGLLEYAFLTLGLRRVQGETNSENLAAWRVMERLGMHREGILREAVYANGRYLDKAIFGILSREWKHIVVNWESGGAEKPV